MEPYLNGMINVNKWFINPSDPNEARQKASDILAKIKTKNNILEQFDVFRDDIVLKSKIIADQYDFKNYGTLNLVFEATDKNNGVKSSRVIDILNFYSQVQVGDFRLLPYSNTRATKSLLKANEIKDTLTKAKSPEERWEAFYKIITGMDEEDYDDEGNVVVHKLGEYFAHKNEYLVKGFDSDKGNYTYKILLERCEFRPNALRLVVEINDKNNHKELKNILMFNFTDI